MTNANIHISQKQKTVRPSRRTMRMPKRFFDWAESPRRTASAYRERDEEIEEYCCCTVRDCQGGTDILALIRDYLRGCDNPSSRFRTLRPNSGRGPLLRTLTAQKNRPDELRKG